MVAALHQRSSQLLGPLQHSSKECSIVSGGQAGGRLAALWPHTLGALGGAAVLKCG